MYVLIIWSALCTASNPGCETGDWVTHSVWGARVTCEAKLETWQMSGPDHRGACIWDEKLRGGKDGVIQVPQQSALRTDI